MGIHATIGQGETRDESADWVAGQKDVRQGEETFLRQTWLSSSGGGAVRMRHLARQLLQLLWATSIVGSPEGRNQRRQRVLSLLQTHEDEATTPSPRSRVRFNFTPSFSGSAGGNDATQQLPPIFNTWVSWEWSSQNSTSLPQHRQLLQHQLLLHMTCGTTRMIATMCRVLTPHSQCWNGSEQAISGIL